MNEKRMHIDPEGKYPSEGLRQAEENALRVLDMLPGAVVERTRDCIQIDYGGEEGVVVLVTAEAIELRLPTVEWTMGSYGPAASSRMWKRMECHEMDDIELESLLNDALKQRKKEFQKCNYCERCIPPEYMHSDNVCQSCAEKHLGVLH